MDEEASLILGDAIAFCQRDGMEARLINMLSQCRALTLTDEALTIEAPSRFAYAYLMKQRATIERYLEEIAFMPLALEVTVPQTAAPAAASAAAPLVSPAPAPAAAPTVAAVAAPQVAAPSAEPAAPSNVAAPTGPMAGYPQTAMPSADVSRETTPTYLGSAAEAGREPTAFETATEEATGVTVTNTMTPEAFRKMMQQMKGETSSAAKPAAANTTPASAEVPQAALEPQVAAVPINSKFTFENFVYGEENKHAYRSAIKFAATAEEPGVCTSLFIYGNSGLGKTHLLLAIKNELAEKKPWLRVKYANSQTYIDDFINEVNVQKTSHSAIMREYHEADVLIIDDIQNIIGKQASIEYFFQLMDEFIRSNKKVAIASDRAPKVLGMDERMTSRFNAGMLCLVSEPGFEMKYSILKRYYETTVAAAADASAADDDSLLSALHTGNGHLNDEQLRHMAEVAGTNIRELESFCERCAGDSWDREQAGEELTGEDIDRIANEYFATARKNIHVDTVQAVVGDYYHVTREELVGPRRNKNIAFARHVAIYLAIDMCEMTTTTVGAEFGGRDHSTVLNSIKVIEKKLKEDRGLTDDLQQLRNKITLRS